MKLLIFCAAALMPCALAGQESSVKIPYQKSSASPDLVITEIMADPDPSFGLPGAEYVEIMNRSALSVNLSGWNLFEGSSRVLPALDLHSGEFLIICANSDTAEFSGYGIIAGVSSLSLTNTGEKVALRNAQGFTVDSVIYSDSWYASSYKKDGGWSLERIDVSFPCQIAENWKPSENSFGGTPGSVNSIAGVFNDVVAPVLLRAYCPDSSSVMLVFSEALDPVTINPIQNYSLSNSLVLVSAEPGDDSFTKVLLQLSTPIQPGQIRTVAVNGIGDCAGNNIAANSKVNFALADTSTAKGIVINEILFNPFEDGYDFVELFHNGVNVIDLEKLRIASVNLTTNEIQNSEIITEEPWIVFPGEYVLLTSNPFNTATQYRSSYPFNFIETTDLPSMNADEGHITILLNDNRLDEFRYHEDYHFPLLEDVKGISLEKINPSLNSMNPSSWHSAAVTSGFATPGLKNSQYAEGGKNDKQVTVNPELFSPDQDGRDDVVIFSVATGTPGYISNLRIYNSSGHVIFENNQNNFVATKDAFSWDGIDRNGAIAPPGIYVALVELFNLTGDVKHFKLPFVLAVKL